MTNLVIPAMPATTPIGWDCGNGWGKLIASDGEILIPSYFKQVLDSKDYEPLGEGAVIEYLEGDRGNLSGTRWLIGETAQIEFPQAHQRIVDDWRHKVTYGLQMLLGAVALMPHQQNRSLSVAASIHDAHVFGAELKKALSGSHLLRLNRRTCSIQITSNICEEGIGALMIARAPGQRKVGLIDLGHGSTIATVFEGNKQIQGGRKVFDVGVHHLVDAIANNQEMRSYLGKPASAHLIRNGLQNNCLYGTTGWSFEDIYNAELKPWVQSCLAPAVKFLQPWLDDLDAVYCIGGGASLAYIAQLLTKRSITVVPNAQKANAEGLLKLAQATIRRIEQ
ncbi:hypothetical protein SAMD00079811_83120 (plasmid) [Scytonema sp. HK-05]|uniref:ParM/StbA family protein n=1 Tax=Scytonema sp. HK-05 TaxID=1137095 RepID=UPI0009367957|nr:ParM/StbA family protein [Scytonema sp. HK-05]OKH44699.1 hypothetical protein NIES2130_37715 [Scytonema sp. HK-05]BAY50681.1 hypothetical protein SAMD00079811_83120 [Scytonema sp. HK-05]